MELGEGVADLHLHTTASDGTDSLGTRIEQATERGLEAIAITDHDVIDKALQRPSSVRQGVEVITGVEIRADLFDTKIELLGYFVDPSDNALQETLRTARQFRRERNEQMVSRVATETGLDLQYESLKEEVSGNLGRPHMAETLVEKGVVSSIGAAFAEYLGENRTAYVPMERLPHETVIEAIHSAGGAVSLAHPGRIRSDHVPEMVDRLVDAGLNGIEAWYPYDESNSDAYSDVGVAEAMTLARTHDLIPTGGSDCHGQESGKFRIGTVRTPESTIDAIRRKSTSYHE